MRVRASNRFCHGERSRTTPSRARGACEGAGDWAIYVGTCGYAYKDWIGPFYPGTIRQSEMLSYYANCFSAVEIDASYYGVLQGATVERMIANTPSIFRFCFKVPQTVTHRPDVTARVHDDAHAFVESVMPVVQAGKFGCALVQFPNSFRPAESGETYVSRVVEALRPVRMVLEFRNREWQTPRTQELLCGLDVGWCNVDMPQYESLLTPGSDVTCGVGYVRFHGRNAAQWWTGNSTTRYDYDYRLDELLPWTGRIADIRARRKRRTHFSTTTLGETLRGTPRRFWICCGNGTAKRLRPRCRRFVRRGRRKAHCSMRDLRRDPLEINYAAVVTAGGRVDGEFARTIGTQVKALAPARGNTLLGAAITALRENGVQRIAVVGGTEVRRACASDVERIIEESEDGAENVRRALRAWNGAQTLLYLTSDMPYITGEALREFLSRVPDATLALPLSEWNYFEQRFPRRLRSALRWAARKW